MTRWITSLVVLCVAGCSGKASPEVSDAGPVERRLFRPRPGRVLAPPPHNIHEGGIGPYKLGATRKEIYRILPHGPRVELLNIERVVDYSLVRTERDGLLIGTSRRSVQFLVAVAPDIAHTEGGPVVGLSLDQVDELAGEPFVRARAADPRIRQYRALPNTRIITDGTRVEAVMVASDPEEQPEPVPSEPGEDDDSDAGTAQPRPLAEPGCENVPAMRANSAAILDAARLPSPLSPAIAYGCGSQAMAIVFGGERLAVVTSASDKPRRSISSAVSGLVFASPLDVDGDGADEIVAVTRREIGDSLEFRVEVFQADMAPLASRDAYRLQADTLRWVGAERLEDTDLLLELDSPAAGQVRIGGVYIQRNRFQLRNVAPLRTKLMKVKKRKPSTAVPADAATELGAPPLPPPPDGGS